jgi:hypothetical protein
VDLSEGRTSRSRAGGYDAFISYSHAADGLLAPGLQVAVQSFAKPWHQRRALRLFRDQTSLAASPKLWPTIVRALEQSRFFILLASPASAASPWVGREVAWWRANRSGETMLVVLTDGALHWDDELDDFSAASSVPDELRGWLAAEPLWIDLRWARREEHVSPRTPRFRDAAASLAAAVRGLEKDDLVGEDLRLHRRAIRRVRSPLQLSVG